MPVKLTVLPLIVKVKFDIGADIAVTKFWLVATADPTELKAVKVTE
jgi:hypothetical protein